MSWFKDLFEREPAYGPSDSPPELAAELIEAEAMADELVDYLLGDRLFRQIVVETPVGTRRPKMTLGGLWDRIEALGSAAELGPNDQVRMQAVRQAWDEARRLYPEQFNEKLKRELDSYLANWKYYLEQRARDPERWDEDYEVEERNRQRVQSVMRLLGSRAPAGLLEDLEEWERLLDERSSQ